MAGPAGDRTAAPDFRCTGVRGPPPDGCGGEAAGRPGDVTPTQVVIAATDLLRAAEVEPFELGMWEAWGIE